MNTGGGGALMIPVPGGSNSDGGGGGGPGGGGGGGGGPPGPGAPPAAAAAGPPAPLSDVGRVLMICGASNQEITALENTEQMTRIKLFGHMNAMDVNGLASRLEKRQGAAHVSLPAVVIKNIQAFCHWAAKARRQNWILIVAEFMQDTLNEALTEMELEMEDEKGPKIKPGELKEEDWEDNIRGKQRAPLYYVIRPDVDPGHVFASACEAKLYGYLL